MADTTISSIFAELSKLDEDTFPPVEYWDPPLCENVHMKIDRNGKWFFMDSVISRERMVKLFSRVLRLDGEEYFLVTPVEKIQEMYETQVLNDGKETDQTTDSDEQSETSDTN